MERLEFVIILTKHRHLGMVFYPYLIQKDEKFYSDLRRVKKCDLKDADYNWKPYEQKLVKLTERYSDEALKKRFSRVASVTDFFSTLEPAFFEKHISPYIEKCMMDVTRIIMQNPVRLFKKEEKYVNLYDEDEINVPTQFAQPLYCFERTETHTRYTLKVRLNNADVLLSKQTCMVVANNPCLMLSRNKLIAFEKMNAKRILPFFGKEAIVVPNTIDDKYYPGFVLNTVRDYEVQAKGFDIVRADAPKSALLLLELNLQYMPCLVLKFEYGNEQFGADSGKNNAVSMQKSEGSFIFTITKRDLCWEQKIKEAILAAGLIDDNGTFTLKGIELLEQKNALYFFVNWLNKNRKKLEKVGIRIEQKKLETKYYTGSQQLELQTGQKGDWFDVYAVVHFGEFEIPFIRLKNYILNNIREFELPNGEIVILPEEWFARYKDLFSFGRGKGEHLQLQKHHFTLLHKAVPASDETIKEKIEQLANSTQETVVPSGLNATLRNYQEEGLNWMYALFRSGMGGCLADDMGLGKTLQTLTLLLKLKRARQGVKINDSLSENQQLDLFATQSAEKDAVQPASLIVVPTSLVHNWNNEIRKFTPMLKVFEYVGTQRRKVLDVAHIADFYDVIITTYGTVRNDVDVLAENDFFYLILDESQAVKNASSKTYKAIMKLKAMHRLVITGTPIENSLSDLWSQMNFLNPGIFGSLAYFKSAFITPIEKHVDEKQMDKLQMMIHPFVLRRKKNEVAKDLPPLMEEIRICPMAVEQKKIYDKEKSIIRNTILASVEEKGANKVSFVVLQGLAKLRQLANHPALIGKETADGSGKFDEIFRMLHNLLAEKHKVLIFSSFVTHLELIEQGIRQENWKYSKLTGQTTNREKVISEFQNNVENRIFLISLKAGGVGLNLTQADYVFILDPWWNPAAENQAINRAHRIGQNKHVFVYRFITKNSIEEKIQKLKERKSALADKFINSNNPFEQVSMEEIVELFD